jgi:MFS family permease
MYQVSSASVLLRRQRPLVSRRRSVPRANRTVVLLGLTSLFTDISSEMVVAVLPLYLVYVGGFSPLAFGLIDGLYQGATAFVGLASGFIGDRWRRHKDVAATGYGLSALCKLLLATVGTAVSAIGAIVLLDRTGKGIRTAPRDAMISLSTPPDQLGTAFGVHRALDTTGAMLGPLVAFALLALAPLAFESIFVVSFCLAMVGLGILVLFVHPRSARDGDEAPPPRPSLRRAASLLRLRRYRALLLAAGGLSLATASDAFVFLVLQDEVDLGTSLFPLLFVGSAGSYMLLAVPMGSIADRVGRGRVLLLGYGLLLAVYVFLLSPLGGWPLLVAALGLLGGYYAATDGVLMALASGLVPEEVRGSGLALLRTATSGARLIASVLFGALWTLWGIDAALACFAALLVAATALAALLLVRTREPAHG